MHRLDPHPTRPGGHPALRQAALVVLLLAATAALARTGPALPLGGGAGRLAHWSNWLATAGPAVAVVAAVRLAALLIGGYLAAVTALAWATTITGSHTLARCAGWVTVPMARRLVTAVTGAGLALTVTAGIAAPTFASAAPVAPTHHALVHPDPAYASDIHHPTLRHPDPAYASGVGDPAPPSTEPAPTMRRLDDDPAAPTPGPSESATSAAAAPTTETTPLTSAPSATASTTTPPASTTPSATEATATAAAPAANPVPPAPTTWTIAPGDHLWRVSSRTLQARWGRAPSDGETARYLGDLIRLNRGVLAVADDPDLVFPGQVFALPPVPAA